MALTALPVISSVAKTDTGSVTNLADATVYGGSNAARNAVAVYILGFKVAEDLTTAALTLNTYDPLVSTSYVATNTTDGYQKYVQLIIPIYTTLITWNKYDVTYYAGALYRSIASAPFTAITPADTTRWEPVTTSTLYSALGTSSASNNMVVGIAETVLTFATAQCLGDVASENAEKNCCGACEDPRLQEKFERLWSLVYFANLANARQKFIEGERFMRDADSYCDCSC